MCARTPRPSAAKASKAYIRTPLLCVALAGLGSFEEGGAGATYPSCGVGCRLFEPLLPPALLALLRRESSSACSTARRLAALLLSEVTEGVRREREREWLLRREMGGLSADGCGWMSFMASVELTSGTVERRSGVLRMERSWAGDWDWAWVRLCLSFVGLTAMVRSMGGGARLVVLGGLMTGS